MSDIPLALTIGSPLPGTSKRNAITLCLLDDACRVAGELFTDCWDVEIVRVSHDMLPCLSVRVACKRWLLLVVAEYLVPGERLAIVAMPLVVVLPVFLYELSKKL